MYGMYFCCCFLYCNLLQLTMVEGLLLPFLYIHTCVIFNKCIQTLKKIELAQVTYAKHKSTMDFFNNYFNNFLPCKQKQS